MATVKVFDVNGREINTVLNENISAGEQSIRINTSNYASGTYIVKIIAEEGTHSVIGTFNIENVGVVIGE